jgi:transcriptional antiterminator NusG
VVTFLDPLAELQQIGQQAMPEELPTPEPEGTSLTGEGAGQASEGSAAANNREPASAAPAPSGNGSPAESDGVAEPAEPSKKRWYVVKVQSGREESIKDAIERRVKIEGLEDQFGQIVIPMEKVVEMVRGQRVTKKKKLYPGYLMVEVEYNDRILYLFRETSGVGDFVGASGPNKAPPPMSQKEIDRIIRPAGKEVPGEGRPIPPKFERGDKVKVCEGPFVGMEGEVKELLEAKEKVRVELVIWNRPVPVELEYWQVEKV